MIVCCNATLFKVSTRRAFLFLRPDCCSGGVPAACVAIRTRGDTTLTRSGLQFRSGAKLIGANYFYAHVVCKGVAPGPPGHLQQQCVAVDIPDDTQVILERFNMICEGTHGTHIKINDQLRRGGRMAT